MQPLKKPDVEAAKSAFELKDYQIIAEVGQGLALPESAKYRVMIKIGELELKTDDPK